MNIIHIISSIDTTTGGPARSVTQLLGGMLYKKGLEVSLRCERSSSPIIKDFESSRGSIHFHQSTRLGKLKGLEKQILNQTPDLLHGQGLWEMPVHQMAVMARKLGIPYFISARGMLDEWSINHKSLKKKIALAAYQKRDLEGALVLHATSASELRNIRKAGFENAVAVIPNGITVPAEEELLYVKTTGRVLFLSRLVPNKGIEELIDAWQKIKPARKEGFILDIVGEGKPDYVRFLKDKLNEKDEQHIRFHGAAYGKEKESFYKNAELFVLPTYTENFGIVVAEALSYGVPVITTKGAPWEDLETHGAGWWIEIGTEPLKYALEEALLLPAASRAEKGKKGRALVEQKYSIEAVAEQMLELYEWVLQQRDTPSFVYL